MHVSVDPSLRWLLGTTLILYVAGMYLLALIAQRRIQNAEDFVVAGRRLPLSLAWMTLLATWFGAGTLLVAADEVRAEGLRAAALDPLGAGVCLLFAGLFVAAPMWRLGLLTVPDLFRRKFGRPAELIASLILVPSYFGWIAAQFVALAGVLELFFGIPAWLGLALVAVVGTGYTLMGGMWSVTLTDAVQISLVLVGLVVLALVTLVELGGGDAWSGLLRLGRETPDSMLVLVPADDWPTLLGWIGVFATGALGNVPGQDLMQRVFAARCERTARRACLVAGGAYLAVGAIPILLALSANLLFPDSQETAILPALARAFLSPPVAVLFLVALLSAILSTIDSAILSPATVLAQNVLPQRGSASMLRWNRLAVLLVASCSLGLAYLGEDAYALLEEAYLLTLVGLFVPLMLGIYTRPRSGRPAVCSMLAGVGVWGLHFCLGWETFLQPVASLGQWQVPVSLAATTCGLAAYLLAEPPWRWRREVPGPEPPGPEPPGPEPPGPEAPGPEPPGPEAPGPEAPGRGAP